MTTTERVQKVVAAETGMIPSPATKFRDVVADSLELVALILELENEFNLDFEDEQNICTVQDAVNYIEKAKAA
jgi:acyl carrier protein